MLLLFFLLVLPYLNLILNLVLNRHQSHQVLYLKTLLYQFFDFVQSIDDGDGKITLVEFKAAAARLHMDLEEIAARNGKVIILSSAEIYRKSPNIFNVPVGERSVARLLSINSFDGLR